ncbi:MAG: iron-sulfur cluster assembly protein [Thermomicrobiales bacterium]
MTDTNTTLDKESVLELLKTVDEPELGQSLVELKMVKDVIVDGGNVTVFIELPTPASTSKPKIQEDVTERLTRNGATAVDIEWSAKVPFQRWRPHGRAAHQRREKRRCRCVWQGWCR